MARRTPAGKSRLAAEYVRMSTDMQVFSLDNQRAAIATYAQAQGFEVVASYADAGKSGLTLRDRPGLSRLLRDIASGDAPFGRVIVYDISRWGRFQDPDEAGHYEFLCRDAGVQVNYCAEPFLNDGSPAASIIKTIKRAMAAEYCRDLSVKVSVGKKRVVHAGFRGSGGKPPFGYRRLMLDAQGNPKAILEPGERKAATTYRVVLTPGPESEQALVRRIYADYLAGGSMKQIAARLRAEFSPGETSSMWSESAVRHILISETYIGTLVFGMTRCVLGESENVDDEQWIRIPNAHAPLVSHQTFEAARQLRIERMGHRPPMEVVRAHAMDILKKHGKITPKLVAAAGFMAPTTFHGRFGSADQMRADLGLPPKPPVKRVDAQRVREIKVAAILELRDALQLRGVQVEVDSSDRLTVDGGVTIQLVVGHARATKGRWGWILTGWRIRRPDSLAAFLLMDHANDEVEGWAFLPPGLWPNCKALGLRWLVRSRGFLGKTADDVWPHIEDRIRRV